MSALPEIVSLRAVTPEDEEFLAEVYASTRSDEMERAGLPRAEARAFLRQQFEAQSRAYPLQYPGAEHSVVLVAGERAGRTWVWRTEEEILLLDVAFLPRFRGRGAGTRVLRSLQSEAGARRVPLRLHVSEGERVASWYRRLGFTTVARHPVHDEMVWRAEEGVA